MRAASGDGAIDISVIIVSWNTRELLERCLRSVEGDVSVSGLRVQIVVVDNGSADGSAEMVARRFPGVRLLAHPENLGFTAASNLGLGQTGGAARLLLNPDTELLPGALIALWDGLHAAPHVGLVGPLLLNPDGTIQSAGYRFPGLAQGVLDLVPIHPRLTASRLNGRLGPGDGLSPLAVDHPLGACMLVRDVVVEQVGGFDEGYFMYSEEIDWCRRIKAAGWTILTVPRARVVHYGGRSTRQRSDAMFLQLHRSRARYLARYHASWIPHTVGLAAKLAAAQAARRGEPERRAALRTIAGYYRAMERDDG